MDQVAFLRQDFCLGPFPYAGWTEENDVSCHVYVLAFLLMYKQGILVAVKLQLGLDIKEGIAHHTDHDQ